MWELLRSSFRKVVVPAARLLNSKVHAEQIVNKVFVGVPTKVYVYRRIGVGTPSTSLS
ncbi:hypothetical protein AB3N59_11055 [Leptospira sp. WS92.C1]